MHATAAHMQLHLYIFFPSEQHLNYVSPGSVFLVLGHVRHPSFDVVSCGFLETPAASEHSSQLAQEPAGSKWIHARGVKLHDVGVLDTVLVVLASGSIVVAEGVVGGWKFVGQPHTDFETSLANIVFGQFPTCRQDLNVHFFPYMHLAVSYQDGPDDLPTDVLHAQGLLGHTFRFVSFCLQIFNPLTLLMLPYPWYHPRFVVQTHSYEIDFDSELECRTVWKLCLPCSVLFWGPLGLRLLISVHVVWPGFVYQLKKIESQNESTNIVLLDMDFFVGETVQFVKQKVAGDDTNFFVIYRCDLCAAAVFLFPHRVGKVVCLHLFAIPRERRE